MALRRPAESSGQPSPAGLQPGPLEVAEASRGAADDALRHALVEQGPRAEGIAELPPPSIGDTAATRLYRLLSGQYRVSFTCTANVPGAGVETLLRFPEEVHGGMILIVRALRAIAPAGAKLRLFENAITPVAFREVVSNVQEYSGEPPGQLVLYGPTQLLGVITETTAGGLAVVRIEGDLVQREPVPR